LINPENPSKTAKRDGRDGCKSENPRGEHKKSSNGVDAVAPNGADDAGSAPPITQRLSVADETRRLKAENPSWSVKRIAAELGQPDKRIERYLTG